MGDIETIESRVVQLMQVTGFIGDVSCLSYSGPSDPASIESFQIRPESSISVKGIAEVYRKAGIDLSDITILDPENIEEEELDELTHQLTDLEKQLSGRFTRYQNSDRLSRESEEIANRAFASALIEMYHADLLLSSSEEATRLRHFFIGLYPFLARDLETIVDINDRRFSLPVLFWLSDKWIGYTRINRQCMSLELGKRHQRRYNWSKNEKDIAAAVNFYNSVLNSEFRLSKLEYGNIAHAHSDLAMLNLPYIQLLETCIGLFEKSTKRAGDYLSMLYRISDVVKYCPKADLQRWADKTREIGTQIQENVTEEDGYFIERVPRYNERLDKIASSIQRKEPGIADELRAFCQSLSFYKPADAD